MDAGTAYNAHSTHIKRQNRSSTNLNQLSLAPLTSKLPINDIDMVYSELSVQTAYTTSYIQGKSAPTTPSLLARSPSRLHPSRSAHAHGVVSPNLPKSKSATHLGARPKSGTTTPGGYHRKGRRESKDAVDDSQIPRGRRDSEESDWLLRAGMVVSTETRESKGQSWLVSRASSTSVGRLGTGSDEDGEVDPDLFERQRIARENALASRHASRRGSLGFALDDTSPNASRRDSTHPSRTGSRSQLATPGDRAAVDSYFEHQQYHVDDETEYVAGPDFVNLHERLEALDLDAEASQDDEAALRKLMKGGHARPYSWFGNILEWALPSVEENDEEVEEIDGNTSDGEADALSQISGAGLFEGTGASRAEQTVPPANANEGGLKDAAWLLGLVSNIAMS